MSIPYQVLPMVRWQKHVWNFIQKKSAFIGAFDRIFACPPNRLPLKGV
jgi:hypothetical protein